ncbi:ankyrin repeat and SOCS box protein 12-like isoform X1 [Eleutherodactylus coqui]|uniref:ankyrin repeat and SOCS box protein 12-like isoform X1 n=1 Tax=Eleutherodactylus coqui TaxID=57060 RepID=UPI0034628C79
MAGFLSSIKELVLHRKACTLIRACKEEELRALLSENEAKKLIRKTSGNVLRRCLQVAIDKQYMGCIEELLKAGANPRILLDSCSVPSIVYGQGNVRLLQLLLEYGASEDSCKGRKSSILLYYAAENGYIDCFRMLLLYGADPDYKCFRFDLAAGTADGTSVLGMCLKRNYEAPFVELLIQFGANIYLPHIQKALLEVDNDATRLLDREKAHPRSLKSQCRIAIRRWLIQVGKLRLIDQIDIPDQLEKYLQYHNEFDDIKKLPRCYQRFTYPIAEHLLFGAGCNYEQEQKYL